jgi:flagellar biosynthesis protein
MEKETPKAVALKYEREKDQAPRIVAKGKGLIADQIMALAKEYNVPLYEDKNLVQVLETLEIDTDIPSELYQAVAQVLAFIYRLNKVS